ncbi:MAG TPA: MBL fold metallo-hydrolase [Gammaproteobacteria bacterium]|jgi:glyoxylase-like metal-dependent hydrolase (beta-lactamase superfamily II)|nr:MBL fold metallo-hydrolase [Gammaproteobacteria bacterium]MDP6732775.1 MBL fold metallo-hydrolase [Gammaproteobacteria bacterium]HAJ75774.1 MBL fold metallo-hydrolase [Gammaproteobacteria bacterium]|tara:strand:+ start:1616 stop:2566 length:951 start_codon:yes stop_codon:yes gene_type:complete
MNKLTRFKAATFFGSVLATTAGPLLAQGNFEGVELSIEHVAGNVYMVQRPGGGGNIGVQIGDDGVLLVDSLFAPLSDKLVAAVREVSDSEIRFLINTHIHMDHVGGNENLAEMGVLIFAHDNTRLRFLEERSHFPRRGGSFAPQQPVGARPVITYDSAIGFHLNGEEVRAFLAPPAHTDGDTFVYFPESDVLHLGDVFRTTSYPIVDLYNGGTLRGTIAALDLAIDMAGPDTKVIPGHGLSIVGREEMQEFLDMILDVRDQVFALIRDGMHLEEVMAANVTAEYDAKWGQEAGWTTVDFVPVVYYELGGAGRLLDR